MKHEQRSQHKSFRNLFIRTNFYWRDAVYSLKVVNEINIWLNYEPYKFPAEIFRFNFLHFGLGFLVDTRLLDLRFRGDFGELINPTV